MIQLATLEFLKGLKENNNKIWFEENRKAYEAAKADNLALVTNLLQRVGEWDAGVKKMQPKECIFRINRDIRFSANKAPYKTNMGLWMSAGGKSSNMAGYYLHIEPNNSFLAGGFYMPEAQILKNIRQEIDYNLDSFTQLLNEPRFKKYFSELGGEKLKNAPKDYPKDHPGVEYLKHKSFTVHHALTDEQLTSPNAEKYIADAWEAMYPFIQFLNNAVGATE